MSRATLRATFDGEVEDQRSIQSVLVLDDDQRVLTALARTLGHHRTVFTSRTCREATEVARRERPDLVVVDMRLDGDPSTSSGIEFVRTLKAELPHATFAVVSGYLTVDSTVAAVRAGADLVLTKPVTGGEILRRAAEAPRLIDPYPVLDTPTLAQAEAEHIARVFADCDGNLSEAARRLGIHRSSLARKLRRRPPDES